MRLFNDHHQKRATALLCMALLVIVSLSCTFILLENHHDCAGEDCPICLAIQQAQSNLTCLGLAESTSTANLPPPPPSNSPSDSDSIQKPSWDFDYDSKNGFLLFDKMSLTSRQCGIFVSDECAQTPQSSGTIGNLFLASHL